MFKIYTLPSLFSVLIALPISACGSQPKVESPTLTVKEEEQKFDNVDQTLIQEVAAISAKTKWCGYDYNPFYLAFMQYERIPNKLSQIQLAFIGFSHGAKVTRKLKEFEGKKCAYADKQILYSEYHQKLSHWCGLPDQKKELAIHCEDAQKEMAR